MIVNGLFLLFFSLSWCVKCQNMCIKTVVVVDIFSELLSVGLRSSITARRVVISSLQCFPHYFFGTQYKHIVSKKKKKKLKPSFSREICKAASFQVVHFPIAQKFTRQIWCSVVRLLFSFLFCLLLDPWAASTRFFVCTSWHSQLFVQRCPPVVCELAFLQNSFFFVSSRCSDDDRVTIRNKWSAEWEKRLMRWCHTI